MGKHIKDLRHLRYEMIRAILLVIIIIGAGLVVITPGALDLIWEHNFSGLGDTLKPESLSEILPEFDKETMLQIYTQPESPPEDDKINKLLVEKTPDTAEEPDTPIRDLAGNIGEKISNFAEEISKPSQTTEEASQEALDYVNQMRTLNGRPAIKWDPRVFSLAGAWSQELYETGQFDHTNPITGNCPAILKGRFGLSANEDVADNLHLTGYGRDGLNPTLNNPPSTGVIDGWMESPGHRYNLLYHDHIAGAYACHGGLCTFMGLNHDEYGGECSTAAEGEAQFAKLESCTPQQLSQYENILKNYDDDIKEYNRKVPRVVSSHSEYQFYMDWFDDLERQQRVIDNFTC